MEIDKMKAKIEAVLFAAGRIITQEELMLHLELTQNELETLMQSLKEDYSLENKGIELVQIENGYQLCSKKEYYEDIHPILDKRAKPRLSNAALETISIIAYNPKITRAEIESIRGVSSDASLYKLLEFGLIEEAGKLDAPGRPTIYRTTKEFLRMFGYSSLEELPELPRYKLDENQQIVIDELVEQEIFGPDKRENEEEKEKREEV